MRSLYICVIICSVLPIMSFTTKGTKPYVIQTLEETGGHWTQARCAKLVVLKVEGAGISAANGIYVCTQSNIVGSETNLSSRFDSCEPLVSSSSTSWHLTQTYLMGKRGRRRVWALAEASIGTVYFAVPALSQNGITRKSSNIDKEDPGEPHFGAWRVAAGLNLSHSWLPGCNHDQVKGCSPDPPPNVTLLPPFLEKWETSSAPSLKPKLSLLIRAQIMLRCGAWRDALHALELAINGTYSVEGKTAENNIRYQEALLALRGLVHLRWGWDLSAGRRDLVEAWTLRRLRSGRRHLQSRCGNCSLSHRYNTTKLDIPIACTPSEERSGQDGEGDDGGGDSDYFIETDSLQKDALFALVLAADGDLKNAVEILVLSLVRDDTDPSASLLRIKQAVDSALKLLTAPSVSMEGVTHSCVGAEMVSVMEAVSRHLMAAVTASAAGSGDDDEANYQLPGSLPTETRYATATFNFSHSSPETGSISSIDDKFKESAKMLDLELDGLLNLFVAGKSARTTLEILKTTISSSSFSATSTSWSSLVPYLNAHLSLASMFSSAGAQREACRHVSMAVRARVIAREHDEETSASHEGDRHHGEGIVAARRSSRDVQVLKAVLLAMVPPILSSSSSDSTSSSSSSSSSSSTRNHARNELNIDGGSEDRALKVATSLQNVLTKLADPRNGWGGVLAEDGIDAGGVHSVSSSSSSNSNSKGFSGRRGGQGGGSGTGDHLLGVRWHFLLAYLGLDQAPTMRVAVKALRHLAGPSLASFLAPHLRIPRMMVLTQKQHEEGLNEQPQGRIQSPSHKSQAPSFIRVGFISAHFRFHSVGRLLAHVITRLSQKKGTKAPITSKNGESASHHGDDREKNVKDNDSLSPLFQVFVIHTTPPPQPPSSATILSVVDPIASVLAEAESRGLIKQIYVDNLPPTRDRHHQEVPISGPLSRWQALLSSLELDVLVFSDVGMDSTTSALAVLGRYAPIQIVFWGHPVTVGDDSGSSIDYFVSSPRFEDNKQYRGEEKDEEKKGHPRKNWMRASHAEQLVLLDGLNTGFERPSFDDAAFSSTDAADGSGGSRLVSFVRSSIVATQLEGRGAKSQVSSVNEMGVEPSEKGGKNCSTGVAPSPRENKIGFHIYICAQNPTKLHPTFDVALVRILLKDPAAVVVLLHNPKQPLVHHQLKSRLSRALAREENVDASLGYLSSRVVFVDQTSNFNSYLALQCAADVTLDPFPFGGGVTILESLSCIHHHKWRNHNSTDNDDNGSDDNGNIGGSRIGKTSNIDGCNQITVPMVVTVPRLQTVPHLAAGMLRHADEASTLTAAAAAVLKTKANLQTKRIIGAGKNSNTLETPLPVFREAAAAAKEKASSDVDGLLLSREDPLRLQHGTIAESLEDYVDEAVRLAFITSSRQQHRRRKCRKGGHATTPNIEVQSSFEDDRISSSCPDHWNDNRAALEEGVNSLWESDGAVQAWRTFLRTATVFERKRMAASSL